MAAAGLALLAAPTRPTSQGLCPTLFRLALVAGGVIELIRFHSARQVAIHFIGQGRMAQPPTPAIAGADMDTQLPGDAPGRAGEAQQKGGEDPVREPPFALGQQRVGEVVEGAPTAIAPVTFQPWPIVVRAPGTDVLALATGTLERAISPAQRMDVDLALFGTEELVYR